jgi:general secretion pathway protein F
MLQIADYLEEQQKLKEQVQHAFTYPIIVSVIAIGIIIYLMTNIVPKIVDVFIRNKQDLPFLTEAMIFISDFIRNYGIYCGIGILCLAVIFKQCLKNKKIAYIWHSFIIKLPIAKKLSIGYNSARFSSTLGILTKSGVPILRSLQAGNNTIGNLVLKKEVEQAIEQVKQGNSLASALKDSHFPTIMLHLIKTGESTGKLANMLTKISEQQSQQIRRYTLFLTTLMEPLLVVIMGGVVMLIVLGVLLPIMEINQFIS